MKLDILAFGAHPDDVELGAGGLLAKEAAEGKKTGIIDLTRGEIGTRGTAEIRDLEAQEAARILGSSVRINLQMADGFFTNDTAHQESVARLLRIYRPDIVIANAPEDRHPDHGKGSELVRDACFLSGLRKWKIQDEKGQELEAWRPKVLYHYIQFRELKPDLIVDISGYHGQKMEGTRDTDRFQGILRVGHLPGPELWQDHRGALRRRLHRRPYTGQPEPQLSDLIGV